MEPEPDLVSNARHISEFEFHRTLGRGAFGKVHLAQFLADGRFYAVKELNKQAVCHTGQLAHTWNERNILLAIRHPLIVECYAAFQSCCNAFLVLEYVAGGDLYSYLRAARRFPDHVARFYAAEVLVALEFLHSNGIIYRDLKPENVLLGRDGHLKLADFGYAKKIDNGVTFTRCGTPEYTAPEILLNAGHDCRVDWWAFGILCYEMLAGFAPFNEEPPDTIYEKILQCVVAYPSHFRLASKDFLRKLLVIDRERRLGAGGSAEIRAHQFFNTLNWIDLAHLTVPPPIIPNVQSDGDAGNFEVYPLEIPTDTTDENQCADEFAGF